MAERLQRAQEILGYTFEDIELLRLATTHPSYSDSRHALDDYERLEFLGDAVMTLIVAEEVFRRFPEMAEGELTKLKIAVVSGAVLTEVGERLDIAELIRVGESERGGTRGRASALENVVEALVGALYLDGGLDAARTFVLRELGPRIDPETASILDHPKSALQEIVQARGGTVEYIIEGFEGPPHDRVFRAAVLVDGGILGTGQGRSKKEAEMRAADQALAMLQGGS